MTPTIATHEQPAHLVETIVIPAMTYADWRSIAIQIGREAQWAYYRWIECASTLAIRSLDLRDWVMLADEIGYSKDWATQRFFQIQKEQGLELESELENEAGYFG